VVDQARKHTNESGTTGEVTKHKHRKRVHEEKRRGGQHVAARANRVSEENKIKTIIQRDKISWSVLLLLLLLCLLLLLLWLMMLVLTWRHKYLMWIEVISKNGGTNTPHSTQASEYMACHAYAHTSYYGGHVCRMGE
jgi:hypothetical protein